MEVVHLDEVVQVNTQEFERDDEVLSKQKLVQLLYNIFLVLRVFLVKLLDQLSFHKPLLIEPFLVLENF